MSFHRLLSPHCAMLNVPLPPFLPFQWAFNWLETRNMEESGNKGLGSTMQSDTSLHDSALKWWDGCEANTLPFNEGLSLAPFFFLQTLCSSNNEPLPLLLPRFYSPLLPGSLMKAAALRGAQRAHMQRDWQGTVSGTCPSAMWWARYCRLALAGRRITRLVL